QESVQEKTGGASLASWTPRFALQLLYRRRARKPPASVGDEWSPLPLAHTMPVWYLRHQGCTDSADRAEAAGAQALQSHAPAHTPPQEGGPARAPPPLPPPPAGPPPAAAR